MQVSDRAGSWLRFGRSVLPCRHVFTDQPARSPGFRLKNVSANVSAVNVSAVTPHSDCGGVDASGYPLSATGSDGTGTPSCLGAIRFECGIARICDRDEGGLATTPIDEDTPAE